MAINNQSIIVPNSKDNISQDNGQMQKSWYKYQQSVSTALTQVNADVASLNTTLTNDVATLTTAIASAVPSGTLVMQGSISALTGYLLCDGSAVSRTTYANLFTRISTTWGAGNGTTTFNVPNLSGLMPIGQNGTYALASTGGSATSSLSLSNIPAHSHTVTVSSNGQAVTGAGSSIAAIAGTTTTSSVGSGTSFNTISPYVGIAFFIKT